jgi:hypothetical protein
MKGKSPRLQGFGGQGQGARVSDLSIPHQYPCCDNCGSWLRADELKTCRSCHAYLGLYAALRPFWQRPTR